MAIICYGQIDKKLIFIIFITIVRTINLILTNEIPIDYTINIISSFEEEIGPIILGIILPFIFKYKPKEEVKDRKSFKYIIFLFLLRGVKSSYEKIYKYFIKDEKYLYNNILNTLNGLEIFLMTLGTFLLMKYKYYIHHYISMIIFCVFGIINDFIIESYSMLNYKYIYIYIIYILNEVFLYCYIKYMMDCLYYHYIEILLYWGITGFLLNIFIFSYLILYEYIKRIDGYIKGIYSLFTETNIFIIIFYHILYFIFDGGIYFLLIFLMLYYLRPNHMIVTDELHVFAGLILYQNKPNKYYTLIPFVFQIIALLFYFEILEFNFCDLNKNTAKNVKKRAGKESQTNTYLVEMMLND